MAGDRTLLLVRDLRKGGRPRVHGDRLALDTILYVCGPAGEWPRTIWRRGGWPIPLATTIRLRMALGGTLRTAIRLRMAAEVSVCCGGEEEGGFYGALAQGDHRACPSGWGVARLAGLSGPAVTLESTLRCESTPQRWPGACRCCTPSTTETRCPQSHPRRTAIWRLIAVGRAPGTAISLHVTGGLCYER